MERRTASAIRRVMAGERVVDPGLALSEGTARNYLSVAIQKLGLRNRVEAARVAEEKGWL
jgi:two-component system response regulator DesR